MDYWRKEVALEFVSQGTIESGSLAADFIYHLYSSEGSFIPPFIHSSPMHFLTFLKSMFLRFFLIAMWTEEDFLGIITRMDNCPLNI